MNRASNVTAGIRKTATCALEASAISAASLIWPRAATTTAPPCSAAFPTIATITAATKKSDSPTSSANLSIEPTTISAISAVTTVVIPRTPSAVPKLQPAISGGSSEMCIRRWRRRESQVAAT